MPSYVPPQKGVAFVFYVSLESQASAGTWQANPTLASGDAKVMTDDGAPANLATLPAVDADSTKRVKVSLSASEMNGDNITVILSDAAGAEWYDLTVNIQTVASGNEFDSLATSAEITALNDPTAAAIADAVWDEATTGHTTAGTFGEQAKTDIDAILVDTAALSAVGSASVISKVSGDTVTVEQYETWNPTLDVSGVSDLTAFENVIFVVKAAPSEADTAAILYVDTTTGLKYIGAAAASAASKGTLTINSATAFKVNIDVAEVASKIANTYSGTYTWTLKGIETGTTPDEATVLASGVWRIERGMIQATA